MVLEKTVLEKTASLLRRVMISYMAAQLINFIGNYLKAWIFFLLVCQELQPRPVFVLSGAIFTDLANDSPNG